MTYDRDENMSQRKPFQTSCNKKKFRQLILMLTIGTMALLLAIFFWHPNAKEAEAKNSNKKPVASETTDAVTNYQEFSDELTNLIQAASPDIQMSVCVLDEEGAEVFAFQEHQIYAPASTYKPPLAVIALNNIIQSEGSYFSAYYPELLENNVKSLIEPAIIDSDNYGPVEMIHMIGTEEVANQMHQLNLPSFQIDNLSGAFTEIDSYDLAHFYLSLDRGEYLNSEETNYLLNLLEQSNEPVDVQSLMPQSTQLLNKYGLLEDHYHDSGIIRIDDRSYYFAILTDCPSELAAEREQLLIDTELLMTKTL